MSETRQQQLARELSHRYSASQMEPRYQRYLESSERDNPPIGLEAPLLDPLDPFLIPAKAPGALVSLAARGAKGYGKLAAEAIARDMEKRGGLTSLAQPSFVVKNKGGNWLTGSVEGALRELRRPEYNRVYDHRGAEILPGQETLEGFKTNSVLNSWIDKQLTRYVKNEMATPEDPIRALAERGVLHTPHENLRTMASHGGFMTPEEWLAIGRGNSPHGGVLGKSPAAKAWEDATDSQLDVRTVKQFEDENYFPREDYPWAKDDTLFVDFPQWTREPARNFSSDLGFPHLIDELRNALNPASGLPARLLLDPSKLDRVSVPQAVQRVSDINAWRAAQKAEADALRANNAATVLHKEYPENNPLGLRWVELRANQAKTQDVWKLAREKAVAEGYDPSSKDFDNIVEELAAELSLEENGNFSSKINKELADALKYEGDTMGHCVGSYCDDVLQGRSRIYSLRDAKGQPHVTIETSPWMDNGHGIDPVSWQGIEEIDNARLPRIAQIKGSGKKDPGQRLRLSGDAPDAHLLPFIQDFVRSGKWSDVRDLHNTGLTRTEQGYFTQQELMDMVKKVTDDNDLILKRASGGSVSWSDFVKG